MDKETIKPSQELDIRYLAEDPDAATPSRSHNVTSLISVETFGDPNSRMVLGSHNPTATRSVTLSQVISDENLSRE